jgi:2-polyprenyl-6-methoxyphenol hydroxylase-like FAD-dependent oxidoreductase
MIPDETDVLIVGAGAAGLTLAIDLARRGVRFALIERLAAPFGGSKGKGLQPRSLEVLEDLGLLDRVLAEASLYPPVVNYDGRREIGRIEAQPSPPSEAEPYPNSLMLPQWRTEALLRERLQALGGDVAWDVELVSFEARADAVRAELRTPAGPRTLRAQHLVGCDGGRSTVRKALGVAFPGERKAFRMLLADAPVDGLPPGVWARWPQATGGQLSLCPLAGVDLFQIAAEIGLDDEPDFRRESLQALVRSRSGWDDLKVGAPSWTSVYHANFRLADVYRCGRVLIAGDAAHAHPPTGGQGLNTSLQDAYNLGWKLGAVLAGADDRLLDSYEAERRPVAAGVLDLSADLLKAMSQRGDMRRGRETLQLDLAYRASPLTLELRAGARPVAAGDRAPDGWGLDEAGGRMRLFEIFAGPRFTLLSYEAAPSVVAQLRARFGPAVRVIVVGRGEAADLRDPQGRIAACYGLEAGDLMLIRPDGYVMAAAPASGVEAVAEHLARWLAPTVHPEAAA